MDCFIGVDLGGTNVRAQAYHSDGSQASKRFEIPSDAQSGLEAVVDSIAEVVGLVTADCEDSPAGIGMAVPGHIDDASGLVKWCPNFGKVVDGVFRYWQDVPLKQAVTERTGMRIVMGNDANVAALGEYMFGSGRNSAHCLVMLTLGTGIGGGVVLGQGSVQGKSSGPLLLLGGNLGGGELGHTLVQLHGLDCNAGSYGSIEAYCQKEAVVRRAVHRLRRGRKSLVPDLVGGDLGSVTPATLSEAAEQGDLLALEVWAEFGMFLGAGIGSMINVFAPDVFAIGGQVSKASPYFWQSMLREAENIAIPSLYEDCVVGLAAHDEDAGVLGGVALARQAFGS